ncbi:hypothetical protein XU18_2825 [Perkinsela sp. CCAP 1560/4]|nr:hypothetical protein XU18_2825 [Perkinsela sp. CCAP 1560/4]|eukprot:KNH06320.1 hypothetical protein XU18_2825 [Perkinsela sp. CCAP 1560/4]
MADGLELLDAYESEVDCAPARETIRRFMEVYCTYCRTRDHIRPRLALVTSGGTIAPLEQNTVRCVTNMSTGKRGSEIAAGLLQAGYWVIFFSKSGSQQPLESALRRFFPVYGEASSDDADPVSLNAFDVVGESEVIVKEEYRKEFVRTLHDYRQGRLCVVHFDTVWQYLSLLRLMTTEIYSAVGRDGLRAVTVVLAAAVSDFYVPRENQPEHKMKSNASDADVIIRLKRVPKLLRVISEEWLHGQALVVAFKLETDPEALAESAYAQITRCGVDICIANLLDSYRRKVYVYYSRHPKPFIITAEEQVSVNAQIVKEICDHHTVCRPSDR